MEKIRITQVKSRIGASQIQKTNLDSLGLKKTGRTVEHDATPMILGMVTKVAHLVKTEVIK